MKNENFFCKWKGYTEINKVINISSKEEITVCCFYDKNLDKSNVFECPYSNHENALKFCNQIKQNSRCGCLEDCVVFENQLYTL
jgi:hypothetical protein